MKRIITLITLVLVLSLLFCSCDVELPFNVEIPGLSKTTVYDTLNACVDNAKDLKKIEIVYQKDGKTLTSTYAFRTEDGKTYVDYEVEEFSTFEITDKAVVIPESYKTKKTGTCTVENGKIVSNDGDIVLENASAPKMKFDASYFNNAKVADDKFTADVEKISAFCGMDAGQTDMTVTVKFEGTAFREIILGYKTAENAEISVTYTF